MTPLPREEALRKTVHVGMAGFALLLRTLTWQQAAAAAAAALALNVFLVPRVAPNVLRVEERVKRFSVGIALYPLVVLLLIFTFQRNLPIAAAGWGYLAFGDGFASIVGMTLGGPRLLWNPKKSLSGFLGYVVFGFLGAAFLYGFVAARTPLPWELGCLFVAALAGAAVESLPSELDDNVLPPLVAAAALALLLPCRAGFLDALEPDGLRGAAVALGINAAVAGLAAALRVVRPSGALAGALLGTVVLGFGGAGLYVLLWVFFLGGTLATRFRKARKEAMGKAEEKGGRRGVANVLANVSVPAFCALAAGLGPHAGALHLAAAAALATALMDTVGTEVGQAFASPTVLLPDFRRVPPGTDGAVSVAGTLAGLAAAGLLAWVGVAAFVLTASGAAAVVLAALLGTVLESLLGRAGAPWRVSNGHVLNFVNTLAGAAAAPPLAALLAGLS
ncbi:MAG TPA: DUF92 domain-containing protein [Thermoanaerobaculia bacterium]|jgi:uncharacterized protein (TIGR00297 family)